MTEPGTTAKPGGVKAGYPPTPGRRHAAPCGREPCWARRRHQVGRPAPAGQAVPAATHPRPRPRDQAGPSSSRRASSRRAKITVKGARYARVLRMALRATLTVIFHGKTRHLSGGRGSQRLAPSPWATGGTVGRVGCSKRVALLPGCQDRPNDGHGGAENQTSMAEHCGTIGFMQVFELHYPGTWLDGVPDGRQVYLLLLQLKGHLADAAVGLALFEGACATRQRRSKPGGMQRQAAVQATVRAMEAQLSVNLTARQRIETSSDIYDGADLQVRRQEWASGPMPERYESRLPFIHAHTVLYALDAIGKILNVLAELSGLPAAIIAARDGYQTALPDVVHVRNSARQPVETSARLGPKKAHDHAAAYQQHDDQCSRRKRFGAIYA